MPVPEEPVDADPIPLPEGDWPLNRGHRPSGAYRVEATLPTHQVRGGMAPVWLSERTCVGDVFDISPRPDAGYRVDTPSGGCFSLSQDNVGWVACTAHPDLLGLADTEQQL